MNFLILASVTDKVVNWATTFIGHAGAWGVFLLMTLESACIPVPSEPVMLFAGFNVSIGKLGLFEVVAAGVAGNVVGSWIAYGVGYFGRIELVERHGKWLHVTPKNIEWADRWFEKYGSWAVFFSRMLPILRTFISLPAVGARMPFWRFTVLTIAGCIPWVLMLAIVGREVGSKWDEWHSKLQYLDYGVAAAIVVVAAYLIIKWRRNKKTPATDQAGS